MFELGEKILLFEAGELHSCCNIMPTCFDSWVSRVLVQEHHDIFQKVLRFTDMKMSIQSVSNPFFNVGTEGQWVVQVVNVAYLGLTTLNTSHLFNELLSISSTESCLGSAVLKLSLFVM